MEAKAEQKHEYQGGRITAMAGGILAHGQIAMNIGRAIGNALEHSRKSCSTFSRDLRVHIQETGPAFYPNLSVVCDPPETSPQDPHALVNPRLIVELLPDSTDAFDRGIKFSHYRRLESLREYVLISQDEAGGDTFYRRDDGAWDIHTYFGREVEITLASLSILVSMADIDHRVELVA